jgi:hypothetical protein
MNRYGKASLLCVFCLIAFGAGCQHGGNTEPHPSHWIGKPASELISAHGAPNETRKSNDGSSVLIWKKPWYIGDHPHECRKSFTIASDNKVTQWSYEDCV